MKDFNKSLIGAEDINFDLNRNEESFAIPQSDGTFRNAQKLSAKHLPILANTNNQKSYDDADFVAMNLNSAILEIVMTLNGIHKFSNEAILSAIQDAGSGAVISDNERNKLNSITDVGSGAIITATERAKLAGLSTLSDATTSYVDERAAKSGDLQLSLDLTPPVGWLFFDDRPLLSKTTYNGIYERFRDGTSGLCVFGETATHFYGPKIQGRFPRFVGSDGTTNPDRANALDRGDGVGGDVAGATLDSEVVSHEHGQNESTILGQDAQVGVTGTGETGQAGEALAQADKARVFTSSFGGSETRPDTTLFRLLVKI